MAVSKGIATTEFALTLVVNIAGLFASVIGIIPPKIGLIIVAGINAIYGILRTIIKINDSTYNIPSLPPVFTISSSSAPVSTVTTSSEVTTTKTGA